MAPVSPPIVRRHGWRSFLAGALLLAVVLLAYLPCLRGGLVWDDDGHITRPGLRSLRGLWRIWTEVGATQQYYPLLHSAFWVEYHLWGGATLGYHLINILLHATAAGLLIAVLRRLAVRGAVLAGLVFALHPIGVESVAWISEQKNTLSAVFYLAAALAYLKFDDKRDRRLAPYLLATLLFVLALLSKTVTATLPAALLIAFWWKRGRLSWRRDVAALVPWFIAGVAAGLWTAMVERSFIGAHGEVFALSFLQRCLLAGRVIWFYLGKAIWPAKLVFVYPRWTVDPWDWRAYLALIALLAVVAALWVRARGGRRGPLAGLLFFAGTLFPALGFFNVYPFRYSFVADHFQYLACLGVIVPVSAGPALALDRIAFSGRRLGWAFASAAAVLFALLTVRQCRVYRSAEILYRATLARNPLCWMAYNNLGVLLLPDPARLDEAIACLRQALRIYPGYAEAHNNMGSALLKKGRSDLAMAQYQTALRLNPNLPEIHNNLGNVHFHAGRFTEAIKCYEEALRLNPDYAGAHADLGNALVETGRFDEAMVEFAAALRIDPASSLAHYNLGHALLKMGRLERAAEELRIALRLNPDDAETHFNLGNALAQSGETDAALREYEEAVRLKSDYAEAQVNLGIALRRAGRIEEAIRHFQAALRIDPNQADAHFSLGNVLLREKRVAEAIEHFEAAVRINPDDVEAQNNLAAALCQDGRIQEAIDRLEAALRRRPDSAATRANLERARSMLALRQL